MKKFMRDVLFGLFLADFLMKRLNMSVTTTIELPSRASTSTQVSVSTSILSSFWSMSTSSENVLLELPPTTAVSLSLISLIVCEVGRRGGCGPCAVLVTCCRATTRAAAATTARPTVAAIQRVLACVSVCKM